MLEEALCGRFLKLFAAVHHRNAIGPLPDEAQVVRDEQQAHRELVAKTVEQLEDLRLDGDVKGCRRFVGDQETRAAGDGHGDHHALTLPTRQLVREIVDSTRGFGNPDEVEQFDRALARGFCRQ